MPQKKKNSKSRTSGRRKRAADRLQRIAAADITTLTADEVRQLVRNLQIHQIELEVQNEELRKTQVELAEARDRYSDLYEFAPVGYLTMDKEGKILEANIAAGNLFNLNRQELLQSNISQFLIDGSSYYWHEHQKAAFAERGKQICEIRMRKRPDMPITVRAETLAFGSPGHRCLRSALIDITEKKAAEDALRGLSQTLEQRVIEQTAQIRLQAKAIENLGEGILITNDHISWPGPHIVFVNEAMCRITGYTAQELLGQTPRILQGKRSNRETLKRVRADLIAGKACHAELVNYRKDRTAYEADVFITPLFDDRGQRTNFVSIHRDITDRKRAENALRESEQRFRQMADQAPVMVWISGPDKLCTWFNKPWLKFTGHSMEDELGNGWLNGVHPDDLTRCMRTYSTSFDARQPFKMEYRLRRHDGDWRWILDTGVPLYQDGGAFVGYIGSCIDVTEQKQAESGLREREERLQAILTTAADAIITLDRRGVITAVNPATEHMFGYTSKELIGQNATVLLPPPVHEARGDMSRFLATRGARIVGVRREIEGRRKDGSTFPLELGVSRVEHLALFTWIVRDITARRQAEKDLDHYRKDLRAMSAELMLAEERQRQRLAQDLHDGLSQAIFLARRKLDEASIKEAGAALDEVGKMVNTLTFELSPPVLRQMGLRPAMRWLAWDMHQRYGLTVRLIQRKCPTEAQSLDEAISLALFRSARELLINVVKHSGTNSAKVTVGTENSHVLIEIADRGKGFDITAESRPVKAGHFGLFSIRERIEYLGGSMVVKTAPGKGTRITLKAPYLTATRKNSDH